jgi:hypothetical protein
MTEPPDDLAPLLDAAPAATSSALRDAVLRQTERHLIHAGRVRRGMRAALVAGIFATGGVAGWLVRTPSAPQAASVHEYVAIPVAVPILVPAGVETGDARIAPLTASSAELQAEQQDDASAAARLYRQAGDAFLLDQDYPNATRCYRIYLARAGDGALDLDTADSWLLVSLKNAAFREKTDVEKNDG